ncbi:MAG TPA: MarR family transcriptional regulator [Propionibacteriaceae bacterium]|nr:MarR family transcriptional regulator [Propionibacteriaceae bacterium]
MAELRAPTDVLAYLVKQAHQQLNGLVDAALEPVGVDRKEFGVLEVLARSEPLSQQRTSATVGIDPTTMVGLIDTLQAKGLVTRTPDPADRRRNVIQLTAKGRETWLAAGAAYLAAEDEFLAPLSGPEAEQFRLSLEVLLGAGTPGGVSRGRAAGRSRR